MQAVDDLLNVLRIHFYLIFVHIWPNQFLLVQYLWGNLNEIKWLNHELHTFILVFFYYFFTQMYITQKEAGTYYCPEQQAVSEGSLMKPSVDSITHLSVFHVIFPE